MRVVEMASADYKIEKDGKEYTPDELREYYAERGLSGLKTGTVPSFELWPMPAPSTKLTPGPRITKSITYPPAFSEHVLVDAVKAMLPDPGEGRQWRVSVSKDLRTWSTCVNIVLRDYGASDQWHAVFLVDEDSLGRDGFIAVIRAHVERAVQQLVLKIVEKKTGAKQDDVHRETQGPYSEEYRADEYLRASPPSDPALRSSDDHWDAASYAAGYVGQHQPEPDQPASTGFSDSAGGGDFAGGGGGDVY